MVKKEFEIVLKDPNYTMKQYKEMADAYMPEITTVMNIEFETKRRFYYYSDDFIDEVLKMMSGREELPPPLRRIYKIIDNRVVFLDYLTSRTVCFSKSGKYVAWWERLRNTKLDGLALEEKLVRDYSSELDLRAAQVRFINTVATNAVYNNNVETDFIEDISDVLSNLNDNHAHALNMLLQTDDGSTVSDFNSFLLHTYQTKKVQKNQRVKNRKKKIDRQAAENS